MSICGPIRSFTNWLHAEGVSWTIGVVVELFMFIFFWSLTAVYVRRANTEFDALTQEIVKEAWKENK